MIVIDGRESELIVNNFSNLEELLVKVVQGGYTRDRVITDVFINDKSFSEVYPHQAEDIPSSDIQRVEIVSMPVNEMAQNITRELYKVVNLMGEGGRQVADLFRRADDSEALELYQDLIDVSRDFLGMIGVLRDEFSLRDHEVLNAAMEEISGLFSEMLEILENEDWILMADMLEYEFLPAVEKWKKVVAKLREDLKEKN